MTEGALGRIIGKIPLSLKGSIKKVHAAETNVDTAFLDRAKSAQANGEWEAAKTLWEKVVQHYPNEPEFLVQLGNMHNELGNYEDALKIFADAIQTDNESLDAVEGVAGVRERMGDWNKALESWQLAIPLASSTAHPARLARVYRHAAQAAFLADETSRLNNLLDEGAKMAPSFLEGPLGLHLRARICRAKNPAQARDLLHERVSLNPTDDAAWFDLASVYLELEDYKGGLQAIEEGIKHRPNDISFLWLATDLAERSYKWRVALEFCQAMITVPNAGGREIDRALSVALRSGNLIVARRMARLHVKVVGGELLSIDKLRKAYEEVGDLRLARLLCRFLMRRWPHSEWHVGQLINLTGATRGLVAADSLVRNLIENTGRSKTIDRAYCQAAFNAHEYFEAQRRLQWFLERYGADTDNLDTKVLLGYVLANSSGITNAEHHFLELASATYQSHNALVGVVHMASRRRDTQAQVDLWSKITAMYPLETIARVEFARATYNLGDVSRAIQICRRRLASVPTDVTMVEFYIWLLIVLAEYEEVRLLCAKPEMQSAPSWSKAQAYIHALGALNRLHLAKDWDVVEDLVPQDSSKQGGNRLYHIVRLLAHFEHPALVGRLVSLCNIDARGLAWIAPYTADKKFAIDESRVSAASTAWRRVRDLVSSKVASKLDSMSDGDVLAILHRPMSANPTVHIINKFEQLRGGSELHAIDLATRLAAHTSVKMWAPETPHPQFTTEHGIWGIDHSQGRSPQSGVFVLIGVYFSVKWLLGTRPDRVIFLYNTFEAPTLFEKIAEVYTLTGVEAELLFCSSLMGEECGLPGRFEPSPIDCDVFCPMVSSAPRPFTVGRHSRDVVEKHHVEDIKVYRSIADRGGQVTLVGGSCMSPVYGDQPKISLLSAKNSGIETFLQGLDVFFYRTSTWVEPWGRVVTEAMACEVPVIVHDVGGYAEIINHGENGLLFHSTSEAIALMDNLANDPILRKRLGMAGRKTVERLLGPAAIGRLIAFYLL